MRTHPAQSTLLHLALAATLTACSNLPPETATPQPSATPNATSAPSPPDWNQEGVPRIIADAERMRVVVKSEAAQQFLAQAPLLPRISTRALFRTADKSRYYTEAQAAALPESEKATLQPFSATEEVYYTTTYGSPISYARPIDILSANGASLQTGTKLLDFGYGYIGHLRLFATMGLHTTGIEVNPLLPALYSLPTDTGSIAGQNGEKGSIQLLDGSFPSNTDLVRQVGSGYNVLISKNVLKKGYIHPERPVPHPERQINLGVSDEVAIKAFFDALSPGGLFLIYNICPAPTPPDKPFVPWSDGRSPFTRAQLEAGGFQVVEFDKDDTEAVRTMGRALGWDQPFQGEPGMDLVNDLAVLYTLVRKPKSP
ncbi:MAG: hypothetical protein IPK82_25950 [Polyangiaceae bacterium]|nr:hypothetical protein [Polyangiaceae bacterium]